MKMRKLAILTVILLILIFGGKVGNGILTNSAEKETALEATRIETAEQSNEAVAFSKIVEEQEIDFSKNPSQEESIIQIASEQETNLGRNTLQEESITQTSETESLTIISSTGRVLTNELCVGLAKEIFDATNAERAKAGLPPLIWDDELAKPAAVRAQEIITLFDHVRADGTKCYALSDLIWGENIAKGPHANGAEFVEHWMASEGHKANILQSQFTTIGVGVFHVEEGSTAVQLFGIDIIE